MQTNNALVAIHIALVAIVATVMLVIIREQRSEWGTVLRILIGAVLFLMVLHPLMDVISNITRVAALARVRGAYLGLLLKVIGIAYLTTFAAHFAYDAGETGTGWRVEVAGKIVILALALPLVVSITETILKMIPS